MKKENEKQSEVVPNFENEDYHKKDPASKGLAATHEQVSDSYMVGEIVPSEYEDTLPRNASKKSE